MADVQIVPASASQMARLDPQALISKALETGAGIDTLERLVALAKDVREVQAREAWYEAMAEFQRTCPPIKKSATAKILTRTGPGYNYKFAPLDEIMSTIQPVMGPLGLSVSWRSSVEPKQVVVSCRVSHTLGHHEESGNIAMPVMEGDSGANPAQRVGIAATYAKRYSLLGIIGMAPEDDDDTAGAPAPARGGRDDDEQRPAATATDDGSISEAQQKRLWAIAREQLWSQDEIKDLLTSFGIEHTKDIPRGRYDEVINKIKAVKKAPPAA